MIELLETSLSWLGQGEALVWATIVTHEGSTPRSAGSKMAVKAAGVFTGTVGGGLVEARVLETASRVLASGRPELVRFDLSGELAAGADMICGGRVAVFLERLDPDAAGLLAALLDEVRQGRSGHLATCVETGQRALLASRNDSALGPETAQALGRAARGILAPVLVKDAGQTWLLEPWLSKSPLCIAGAGHVSRPTAALAAMTGFAVTVVDDRPEFANAERFPGARVLVRPMLDCLADMDLGPESSVVIVTRGHVHDAEVLAQALATRAGYVGMIGSARKREAVYARLRGQGATDDDLARVHCPIGLAIQAETPEEIAVSIVAELIQARAARRGA